MGQTARRPLVNADLLRMRWLDQPRLSADGRRLAYTETWLDDARDEQRTAVVVDGRGRATQYVYDARRPGGSDDPNVVDQALAFLNGAPFLDLMRGVTGDDRIDFADAQASGQLARGSRRDQA